MGGIVVAGRQRVDAGEAADRRQFDHAFDAGGNNHIGAAAADPFDAVGNSLGTGGTGGGDGVNGAMCTGDEADVIGGHVGQEAGEGKGVDAIEPPRAQRRQLAVDNLEAAGARADDGAGAIGVWQRVRQLGIGQRHTHGGNDQVRRAEVRRTSLRSI